MAENPRVHRVPFTNETTATVTFVVESRNGLQTAFTLIPNGPAHFEEVHTPLTHEQLRLVVGATSTGHPTNLLVSTDELTGLDEVVVTWEDINPGNNSGNNSGNNFGNKVFILRMTPRNTNARLSAVTRLWQQWWPRSRNDGATRDTLGA